MNLFKKMCDKTKVVAEVRQGWQRYEVTNDYYEKHDELGTSLGYYLQFDNGITFTEFGTNRQITVYGDYTFIKERE